MCTYVCSSAQLFISRNNDFEIRANEYSLTHSQFQLHSLSPLPPSLSHSVSNPFSIPLLLFPLYYPFYRGCLCFIGHGSVARVGGVEDSPEVSPSACVSNRSPLFVWFARRVSPRGKGGPQLFRSTVEDLFPFVSSYPAAELYFRTRFVHIAGHKR